MSGAAVFALMMAFSFPVLAILIKSDIGRAIADAIRHNSGANEGAAARQEIEQMRGEIEQLRTDLDDMNTQLLETQERLDFAERLLVKPGAAAGNGGPSGS